MTARIELHAAVCAAYRRAMGRDMDAEVWQSLGEQDADWAVATTPGRKHGGWSQDLEDFYATGREMVGKALALVPEVGNLKALDWGSGTGRLSFALAEKFERVTCVDVSTSMQMTLRGRARERGISNLDIVHVDDFDGDASHDFALSLITIQHFPDRETVELTLRSMVAGIKPGGWLIVEIPESAHTLRDRIRPKFHAYRLLRRAGMSPKTLHAMGFSGIRMLCIPKSWVTNVLEGAGIENLHTNEYRGTSHQQVWYVAQKSVG